MFELDDVSQASRDETDVERLEAALAGFAEIRRICQEQGLPDVDAVALVRKGRRQLEERGIDLDSA